VQVATLRCRGELPFRWLLSPLLLLCLSVYSSSAAWVTCYVVVYYSLWLPLRLVVVGRQRLAGLVFSCEFLFYTYLFIAHLLCFVDVVLERSGSRTRHQAQTSAFLCAATS